MAKIHEMIGKTAQQHQDDYMSLYMRWCQQFSAKTSDNLMILNDFQKLLANARVHNWFSARYTELEQQAEDTLKVCWQKITVDQARGMYGAIMAEIFRTYPKPLFEDARKLSLIGSN